MAKNNVQSIISAHKIVLVGTFITFVAATFPTAVAISAIPVAVFCAWQMLKAIDASKTVWALYLALMLIPLVNVFALMFLNRLGRKELRKDGFAVGFFGVKDCANITTGEK